MVHRGDLARLYVLAAESSAEAASRAAGSPTAPGQVASLTVADAVRSLGAFAECLALDQHVDSGKAVRLLGWQPRHAGFVDEVERCFLAWKAAAKRPSAPAV